MVIRSFYSFLPLLVIASVPLWNGINTNNSPLDITLHILTMINVGFLFVILFIKSKSLLPAIICHILINSLSVFSINSEGLLSYLIPVALIVISLGYSLLVIKLTNDESKVSSNEIIEDN